MQQNINYQALTEKWAPLLDYEGVDAIKDQHRRNVTAVLLENQEQMLREENAFQSLTEASPTNSAGTGGFSGTAAAAGPCLLYTSPSPRDNTTSRMPSSA